YQAGAVGNDQPDPLCGHANSCGKQDGIGLGPSEIYQQGIDSALFSPPAKSDLRPKIGQPCRRKTGLQGPGGSCPFTTLRQPPVKSELGRPWHDLSESPVRLRPR